MKISTVIPTYRRPQDLKRCLEALQKQTRQPDQIIVVVRDTDSITWTFINSLNLDHFPLSPVKVTIPGQVAALNAGLEAAQGDIIAITDDDAMPHPDWLERIETHFLADANIAGVGGRDWVYINNQLLEGEREIVGKVSWWGRVIGNHHLGVGKAREVDILKGANMSFRSSAILDIRFDERLKGSGAQVDNDMAFCLKLKRTGKKLIYDPAVAVDHLVAERFDEDQRNNFNPHALSNAVHNETLILLEYFSPIKKLVFILWAIAIGTRKARGLVQLFRFLPQEKTLAVQKWLVSINGRWQGWLTWKQNQFSKIKLS